MWSEERLPLWPIRRFHLKFQLKVILWFFINRHLAEPTTINSYCHCETDIWLTFFFRFMFMKVKRFSPSWILPCCFICDIQQNLFPQVLHKWGFSPTWILMWTDKLLARVKSFPQVLQESGFSPVWILRCAYNLDLNIHFFPHVSHLQGFSTLCLLCLVFDFDFAALVDPESPCLPPSWFWLSATWELWERSWWSLFGSGSLWSLSS